MSISRLDLDGVASPEGIAARIHELLPDLATDFSIEELCSQLDIVGIALTDTDAYEAALIMDANKAAGSILLARSSDPKRRRFSIGHELGHFLMPTHMPRPGEQFSCSQADLSSANTREKNRHMAIEAEANRFAAQLLMPPARIRSSLTSPRPDLAEIVRLAREFGVSKEAMTRSYVEAHPSALAAAIVQDGTIVRIYRSSNFPCIEIRRGDALPACSSLAGKHFAPGQMIGMQECACEPWTGQRAARKIASLHEQVLMQHYGFATILLHAELA